VQGGWLGVLAVPALPPPPTWGVAPGYGEVGLRPTADEQDTARQQWILAPDQSIAREPAACGGSADEEKPAAGHGSAHAGSAYNRPPARLG
jgi:hypothetical protein